VSNWCLCCICCDVCNRSEDG